MEKIITSENFETEILKSEKPILIDFWATWCGPMYASGSCGRRTGSGRLQSVGKVDCADQEPGLAQQFKIMSIPTLLIFKDGKEVQRFIGLTPKDTLRKFLEG